LIKSTTMVARAAVDDTYGDAFATTFERLMLAKLGLRNGLPDDVDFIGKTFGFPPAASPGFHDLFFRTLSKLPAVKIETTASPTVNPENQAKTGCPVPRPVYRPFRLRRLARRLACPAGANAVGRQPSGKAPCGRPTRNTCCATGWLKRRFAWPIGKGFLRGPPSADLPASSLTTSSRNSRNTPPCRPIGRVGWRSVVPVSAQLAQVFRWCKKLVFTG
jgi:hypothetical protein